MEFATTHKSPLLGISGASAHQRSPKERREDGWARDIAQRSRHWMPLAGRVPVDARYHKHFKNLRVGRPDYSHSPDSKPGRKRVSSLSTKPHAHITKVEPQPLPPPEEAPRTQTILGSRPTTPADESVLYLEPDPSASVQDSVISLYQHERVEFDPQPLDPPSLAPLTVGIQPIRHVSNPSVTLQTINLDSSYVEASPGLDSQRDRARLQTRYFFPTTTKDEIVSELLPGIVDSRRARRVSERAQSRIRVLDMTQRAVTGDMISSARRPTTSRRSEDEPHEKLRRTWMPRDALPVRPSSQSRRLTTARSKTRGDSAPPRFDQTGCLYDADVSPQSPQFRYKPRPIRALYMNQLRLRPPSPSFRPNGGYAGYSQTARVRARAMALSGVSDKLVAAVQRDVRDLRSATDRVISHACKRILDRFPTGIFLVPFIDIDQGRPMSRVSMASERPLSAISISHPRSSVDRPAVSRRQEHDQTVNRAANYASVFDSLGGAQVLISTLRAISKRSQQLLFNAGDSCGTPSAQRAERSLGAATLLTEVAHVLGLHNDNLMARFASGGLVSIILQLFSPIFTSRVAASISSNHSSPIRTSSIASTLEAIALLVQYSSLHAEAFVASSGSAKLAGLLPQSLPSIHDDGSVTALTKLCDILPHILDAFNAVASIRGSTKHFSLVFFLILPILDFILDFLTLRDLSFVPGPFAARLRLCVELIFAFLADTVVFTEGVSTELVPYGIVNKLVTAIGLWQPESTDTFVTDIDSLQSNKAALIHSLVSLVAMIHEEVVEAVPVVDLLLASEMAVDERLALLRLLAEIVIHKTVDLEHLIRCGIVEFVVSSLGDSTLHSCLAGAVLTPVAHLPALDLAQRELLTGAVQQLCFAVAEFPSIDLSALITEFNIPVSFFETTPSTQLRMLLISGIAAICFKNSLATNLAVESGIVDCLFPLLTHSSTELAGEAGTLFLVLAESKPEISERLKTPVASITMQRLIDIRHPDFWVSQLLNVAQGAPFSVFPNPETD